MSDKKDDPFGDSFGRVSYLTSRIESAKGIDSHELRELKETVPMLNEGYAHVRASHDKITARLEQDQELLAQAAADRTLLQKLTSPPLEHGTLLEYSGKNAVVSVGSKKLTVPVHPKINPKDLQTGREVLLVDSCEVKSLIQAGDYPTTGVSARVRHVLGGDRLAISTMGDAESIVYAVPDIDTKPGDLVLLDRTGMVALGKLPRKDKQEYFVENVPNVGWNSVGGIDSQIRQLKRILVYPYISPAAFERYTPPMSPVKGMMLYGPPGCGKTLLMKAAVNEMFAMRKDGMPLPVVVFFDEADSLFGVRGGGIPIEGGAGGTMSDTIVPTLLAELQGLEDLNMSGRKIVYEGDVAPFFYYIGGPEILNKYVGTSEEAIRDIYASARERSSLVITVFATNRPDKIDPALMREGRFDRKIRVPRPDEAGARQTLSIYLMDTLPINGDELTGTTAEHWRRRAADYLIGELFGNREPIAEVHYREGNSRPLYRRDLVSGAKIHGIVSRVCDYAACREVEGEAPGLRYDDLRLGVQESYAEEIEMLTSGSPQKWSQILGRESDRILRIVPSATYAPAEQETFRPRTSAI